MIETIALGLWWAISLMGLATALIGAPTALVLGEGHPAKRLALAALFSAAILPLAGLGCWTEAQLA